MDDRGSRFSLHGPTSFVDVTVRGVDDIATIVSHARITAAAVRRRTGHVGPYVVTVESVGERGCFATVRAGEDARAPEVGCIDQAAPDAVERAFTLLAHHLDTLNAA